MLDVSAIIAGFLAGLGVDLLERVEDRVGRLDAAGVRRG
jgi:hypothetical protein